MLLGSPGDRQTQSQMWKGSKCFLSHFTDEIRRGEMTDLTPKPTQTSRLHLRLVLQGAAVVCRGETDNLGSLLSRQTWVSSLEQHHKLRPRGMGNQMEGGLVASASKTKNPLTPP